MNENKISPSSRHLLPSSGVNSDFKCVWGPPVVVQGIICTTGDSGPAGLLGPRAGTTLEVVFLFEGQMQQPQNEDQMKEQIWER